MTRFVFAFAASLVVASTARASFAQSAPSEASAAEARRQYDLATAAFEAKRYADAAAGYDAAVAIRPHPVTLFIAAVAWDEAKQPERAADDYARAMQLGGLDAERLGTARSRLAQLEQSLGTLVITAPQGWRARLDGARPTLAPVRLHGTPGSHTLSTAGPDGNEEARAITLVAGQSRSIALGGSARVAAAPAPAPAPSPESPASEPAAPEASAETGEPSHGWPASRVIGVTGMGLGAAAIGAAVYFGVKVLAARDDYNAAPTRDAFDRTRELQTVTNVCWIGGGALVAVGAAVAFLPDVLGSSKKSASIGLTVTGRGIGLRGAF